MDALATPLESKFLRGETQGTDVGYIPTPVTSKETTGPANRGVEQNTARGVKAPMVVTGITHIEYGSDSARPEVMPFKTHGFN